MSVVTVRKSNSNPERTGLRVATETVRAHFLGLLLGAYALAALWPGPGLTIRQMSLGTVPGSASPVTMPLVMLAVLLFCAGLGTGTDQVGAMLRRPALALGGAVASWAAPLLFVLGLALTLAPFPNAGLSADLLLGVALVAAMPVANSSAGWTQTAGGNLALSLFLVLLTTTLSPISVPATLRIVGWTSTATDAAAFERLAASFSGHFLVWWVVLPSLLGVAASRAVGSAVIRRHQPVLHLTSFANLLVLNYANAAVCLPHVMRNPDAAVLSVALLAACGLAIAGYGAAWLLAGWLRVDRSQQSALLFGLGMKNTGAALVLASTWRGDQPVIALPIIVCTLIQHVVAGGVNARLHSRPHTPRAEVSAHGVCRLL